MTPYLSVCYGWLKVAHLIAVIAWMVGLLYLPRLFAYHAEVGADAGAAELLQQAEHRLLRHLMNPAMLAVFALGISLIVVTHAGAPGTGGWLHAKILLALILAALQGIMARFRRNLALGQNTRSPSYYRGFHWILVALMVAVVVLVIRRPF